MLPDNYPENLASVSPDNKFVELYFLILFVLLTSYLKEGCKVLTFCHLNAIATRNRFVIISGTGFLFYNGFRTQSHPDD
ncbi:MAG TPA: hypothetical protein VFC65_09595 [Prolixibacteraceae bacterium]|nr:hypothetical protein [Prolixibacteraceae bacterium]